MLISPPPEEEKFLKSANPRALRMHEKKVWHAERARRQTNIRPACNAPRGGGKAECAR
jgi:hypothetical protein